MFGIRATKSTFRKILGKLNHNFQLRNKEKLMEQSHYNELRLVQKLPRYLLLDSYVDLDYSF